MSISWNTPWSKSERGRAGWSPTVVAAALAVGSLGTVVPHARAADAIVNQLKQGANFSNPASFWTGNGIVTSLTGSGSSGTGAIGVAVNDFSLLGQTGVLYTSFDGQTVGVNDVLVKYTDFGDADLDGTVSTADYAHIENGFKNHLTGWLNGDFDYDGAITTTDYFLIDNAFLGQTRAAVPAGTGNVSPLGGVTPVPEPTAAGAVTVLAATATFVRRRRRSQYRECRGTR